MNLKINLPTDQSRIKVETVVIRFKRQTFYAEAAVYQAEVRASSLLLRGAPFHADIEQQLDDIRTLFATHIKENHTYTYLQTPDDFDPEVEAIARELEELGERLYHLLPETLREGIFPLLQHAFDAKHNIHLIFEAKAGDQADQLLNIPWEIIYIRALKNHLGLMPRLTIERRLLETVRQAEPQIEPPFRIAHVIAETSIDENPAGETISPELQEAERQALARAAGDEDCYALIAKPGSVERLREALRQQPYQIVHFLGHGTVDRYDAPQIYLQFEGQNHAAQLVTAEQLAQLLGLSLNTQVVVLNACHGASVEATNTMATQLVYNGIPYVVAMQGEIHQKAAALFAECFYGALQSGASLAEAVAASRQEINSKLPGAIDWCLPALYVSAGTDQAPVSQRVFLSIERWLSQPEGKRQLSKINFGLGSLHLIVALLLALSGAAPALPGVWPIVLIVGVLALVPPLFTFIFQVTGQLPNMNQPTLTAQTNPVLLLRILTSTAIGLGLPSIIAWFTLLLLVGLGFWALLSPLAQLILLVLLFTPGLLLSWEQAHSHGHGLLANAQIEPPPLELDELFVFATGYLLLLGPLLLLWIWPQTMRPPLGNLISGIMLCTLGYKIRKEL